MKRTGSKLRRQIACEAGRLLHERVVSDYRSARRKAIEKLALRSGISADDFPTDREIRRQIRAHSLRIQGRESQADPAIHLVALRLMRALDKYQSRLLIHPQEEPFAGSAAFTLAVFSDQPDAIARTLQSRTDAMMVVGTAEGPMGVEAASVNVGLHGPGHRHTPVISRWQLSPGSLIFDVEVSPRDEVYRLSNRMGWLSVAELEMLMAVDDETLDLAAIEVQGTQTDRFVLWAMLLSRLERVKQDPQQHPEGDALYHSLQTFEGARNAFPYDVELITAALLHDVGKAIDPRDHVGAGLAALAGTLTQREEFLIAHHMDAQAYRTGGIAQKLKVRLQQSEWFEDLMALRDIDDAARQRGVAVCSIEEALGIIEELSAEAD